MSLNYPQTFNSFEYPYLPMNSYYRVPPENMEKEIDYKKWVGGRWDEQGNLQKNFLISQGLKPEHKFLDLGCGCLRAGIKLIDFLDKYNYYGQDVNPYLVKMGLEQEVPKYNLQEKINKKNFSISADFTLSFEEDVKFDMAISQSVFTHLPINHLYFCLLKLKNYFLKNSKFFVSFWLIPEESNLCDNFVWSDGLVTSHISDTYHYKKSQIESIILNSPINQYWDCSYIGNWNHPVNQKMFCFIRK